eukprot:5733409-Alexandrium_andersonii.AAC.1
MAAGRLHYVFASDGVRAERAGRQARPHAGRGIPFVLGQPPRAADQDHEDLACAARLATCSAAPAQVGQSSRTHRGARRPAAAPGLGSKGPEPLGGRRRRHVAVHEGLLRPRAGPERRRRRGLRQA